MAAKEPLAKFAAIRTDDPDLLRECLAPVYAIRSVDVPRSRTALDARFNHCELQDVGISYGRYGSRVNARLAHGDFYAQGFGIGGYGETVVDGHLYKVCDKEGAIGGPGAEAQFAYAPGFKHLFMKIKPEALTRKLAALIGAPVHPPLQFDGRVSRQAVEAQFRLLRFIIAELDSGETGLPPLVVAELEQALIVAYLCGNRHNYSHMLSGEPPAPAPWQVRRAADFIEAHWHQPITIETLAVASDLSARSLFAAFKKTLGCSPMTFVKRVRLTQARDRLTQPARNASVTSVALDCGFNNLGHFAKDYTAAFGELPSDTLKRGKSNGAT